ncbi:MAG: MarR family transcriptional regulator [Parvibaculaceae bacterium]|nr:MarR family transcriptional regulator [Parvibaculaceae bacterium]
MADDPPERRFGYVLSESSRLLRRVFNGRAQATGLTLAQWRALSRIAHHEGLNQVSLAELLEIQPITVARLVDRLEQSGWVERRPDPADRRAQRLFLTAEAAPLMEQLWGFSDEVARIALDGLTPGERKQFIEMLAKVSANLGAAAGSEGTLVSPRPLAVET